MDVRLTDSQPRVTVHRLNDLHSLRNKESVLMKKHPVLALHSQTSSLVLLFISFESRRESAVYVLNAQLGPPAGH